MKVHNYEQRSPQWYASRCGIPTASAFEKICTPTGKASSQSDAYMNTLLAEWITGLPGGMEPTPWMQRGVELEPEARAFYEMARGVDVQEVGFITRDDDLVGCSPDGLLGGDGMLEIKVPSPGVHVEYLLSGDLPSKYRVQVQGQLYIAERQWADFLSYSPDMPCVLVRVERDEAYIKSMVALIDKFIERMLDKRAQLIRVGVSPVIPAGAEDLGAIAEVQQPMLTAEGIF